MITFFDTETCGFDGPVVLIQYAVDDNEPVLYAPWLEYISDTLEVLNSLRNVVGFNLAYDWFHVQRLHNLFSLALERLGDIKPIAHIDDIGALDGEARFGPCIKPESALDLMLYARKGPYQSLMDRKSIRIRRVPKHLTDIVKEELTQRLGLKPVYFSGKPMWAVEPVNDELVTLRLQFSPSTSLKAIVKDLGIRDDRMMFDEVRVDGPPSMPWAPHCTAYSKGPYWEFRTESNELRRSWPAHIMRHIEHWCFTDKPREYAMQDVLDTREVYRRFGNPELGDDDSTLACMSGSIRWRGMAFDTQAAKEYYAELSAETKAAPTGQAKALLWLEPELTEIEKSSLKDNDGKLTTKKIILQELSDWTKSCSCVVQKRIKVVEGSLITYQLSEIPDATCVVCKGTGVLKHPAAEKAAKILKARQAKIKRAALAKLIQAGRFHPSMSVIGSLSGRMSGRTTDSQGSRVKGLNALGIDRSKRVRRLFKLADDGYKLEGGDFEAYEIAIAAAVFNDPILNDELLTCWVCNYLHTPDEYRILDNCPKCGTKEPCRKFHALFGVQLFPGETYESITASKGTANDMYDKAKRCVFGGLLYGGDEGTMERRVGIPKEIGKAGRDRFLNRYKGVLAAQHDCYENHCSMRQPGGLGTKVFWNEPAPCVESLQGFKRWFTLENEIASVLFNLADKMPKDWKFRDVVTRYDKPQPASAALRSALIGAAFQLQAACMRAALNHKIQSTGAIETKRLQRLIWDKQPAGINPWLVVPLNIHDEIMCPSKISLKPTVQGFIDKAKSIIPLIKMDWRDDLNSWADK